VPVRQLQIHRMLLADWFANLAGQSGLDFEQHGSSGEAFTLGAPNAFHVTAHFIEKPPFLNFVPSDPGRQGVVDAIVREAVGRVERGDLGGRVWYSTELHEVEYKPSSLPITGWGPLLQRLGNQTRILGWRRLGNEILLEFVEELPRDWDERRHCLHPRR
jgi:hypothetical protein